MTLGDFLNVCEQNQSILLFFSVAVPLTALLAKLFGSGEGHKSPWKYLYSLLMYLVCIPGIFAITLNIYLMIFEGQSILNANLYSQILPIVTMLVTLWLIRWNVSFDDIPGFSKIGSLVLTLTLLISLLWILEKTKIFVISFMPFHYFLILIIGILILLRYGMKRLF